MVAVARKMVVDRRFPLKNFVKVVIGGIGSLTRGEEVVVDAHGGSYCIGSVEEKGKPEYARKKCLVAVKLENQQETQPAFGLPRRCRKWNPCHIILMKGEY